MEIINLTKILIPFALTFFIGIAITPILTHYLYKHKMWKKRSVQATTDGRPAPISQKLHADEQIKTPRMGGVVVWGSALICIIVIWLLAHLFPNEFTKKLEFVNRSQTWLPLFALLVGAIVGLVDDYFAVSERYDQLAGGLSSKKRLFVVAFIGLIGAWWFFFKLGVSQIYIPFMGELSLGWLFIPFFIAIMVGIFAGGVIDGIDGLSGGVFAAIFSAYGLIAFLQNQINIAAFCMALVGGILAFLWFNIPPARFYMSDTGMMALTLALGIIAFATNQVAVLPIIAFPLVVTAGSSAAQLLSKKMRNGKKLFLVAPLHHYFQAIGWPSYKVTMRYWVVSVVCASMGVIIALVG